MKTKLNPFYWLIILLSFDFILLRGLISGDITNFLHPKMVPFVSFSLAVFVVLTVDQAWRLTRRVWRDEKIKWGVLIYLIPITIGLINPQRLSADVVANRSTNLGAQMTKSTMESEATGQLDDNFIEVEQPTDLAIPDNAINDEFVTIVNDIQSNLDDYLGKQVTLRGFVFRADNFDDSQFVVGRLLITCCVADAGVLGLMVTSDAANELEVDQWVEVTGNVATFEYSDPTMSQPLRLPQLIDVKVTKIEPLESPYVYE